MLPSSSGPNLTLLTPRHSLLTHYQAILPLAELRNAPFCCTAFAGELKCLQRFVTRSAILPSPFLAASHTHGNKRKHSPTANERYGSPDIRGMSVAKTSGVARRQRESFRIKSSATSFKTWDQRSFAISNSVTFAKWRNVAEETTG